jgi:predicted metal-dependent peptidase
MTAVTNTANKDDTKRFADLIGPTDPKLDREIREALVTARIGMLLKASFFGNLATRLKLVNADEWCSTAATDGRNFYYNTRFIKMLKFKEIEFLFGHEILHCIYDHFGRCGNRDPQLWNIAGDFCNNADLKKHKIGEFITSVPCLYDEKYEGMSAEEVYDDLYKNAKKININDLLNQMIDDHLDHADDNDSDKGDGKDGQGMRPSMSAEERQQVRDELKEAMLSAAQTCGVGNLPMGVKRLLTNLTEPKMDWRELLRMQLESTIKSDYTWLRSSRKGWHMDAIMPGMRTTDAIDIAVMIDMSGSISDQQGKDFVSEIKGIMETFEDYRIYVGSFDTDVYNVKQYTSDNLEDITEYQLTGGGGTDFECIFHYLKEHEIEPKKLVVFTDGYPCGDWGDANYCDTVWIIHSNSSPAVPFGTWAMYDEAE